MLCGTPGRTPPRRPAFVGRLTRFVCLCLLAVSVWAGPASPYPCGPPTSGTRTQAGHLAKSDEKECEPPAPGRRKRGNADPVSFAFFIGIVVAAVLVPVALGKREDLPPE